MYFLTYCCDHLLCLQSSWWHSSFLICTEALIGLIGLCSVWCKLSCFSEIGARLDSEVGLDTLSSLRLPDLLSMSSHVTHSEQRSLSSSSLKSSSLRSTSLRSGSGLARPRSRRSVFLQLGVKICPQESLSEVLASHRAYYQIRGIYYKCITTFTKCLTRTATVQSHLLGFKTIGSPRLNHD